MNWSGGRHREPTRRAWRRGPTRSRRAIVASDSRTGKREGASDRKREVAREVEREVAQPPADQTGGRAGGQHTSRSGNGRSTGGRRAPSADARRACSTVAGSPNSTTGQRPRLERQCLRRSRRSPSRRRPLRKPCSPTPSPHRNRLSARLSVRLELPTSCGRPSTRQQRRHRVRLVMPRPSPPRPDGGRRPPSRRRPCSDRDRVRRRKREIEQVPRRGTCKCVRAGSPVPRRREHGGDEASGRGPGGLPGEWCSSVVAAAREMERERGRFPGGKPVNVCALDLPVLRARVWRDRRGFRSGHAARAGTLSERFGGRLAGSGSGCASAQGVHRLEVTNTSRRGLTRVASSGQASTRRHAPRQPDAVAATTRSPRSAFS